MDNARFSAFEILNELGDAEELDGANEDLGMIIEGLEEGAPIDVAELNVVEGGRRSEAEALLTALNTYRKELLALAAECRDTMKDIAAAAGVPNPAQLYAVCFNQDGTHGEPEPIGEELF